MTMNIGIGEVLSYNNNANGQNITNLNLLEVGAGFKIVSRTGNILLEIS